MTRLLAPDMFGVMSIAMMFILGLTLFSDLGLKQNVVQSRRGGDSRFLNTVWVLKIGIGVLLVAGSAVIAYVVAVLQAAGALREDSAYSHPQLPSVLLGVGFSAFITACESTKALEAGRNLSLAMLTRIQLVAQATGILTMIVYALLQPSIWALVVGSLVSAMVGTVLTHWWLPGTSNAFQWDNRAFAEIHGFGRWILASSIAGFLATSGDRILLGAFATPSLLGVYTIAMLLFGTLENALNKVAYELAFPAFSEVARERRPDLRSVVYKVYIPVFLATLTAAMALTVTAPAIVRLLYDDRYLNAGWMLQLLGLGLLAIPARVHAVSLLALGRSRQHATISAVRLAIVFLAVWGGWHLAEMRGAVLGVVAAYLSVMPVTLIYASRERLVSWNT
jgi:O-antigen/teichoic acid export membrane protein